MKRREIESIIREKYCDYAETVIERIKDLGDDCLHSGDDSPYRNMWEEFAAQVQGEHSIFFDAYEETIRSLCRHFLKELPRSELKLLWLYTDGYWNYEPPENAGESFPHQDELIEAIENEIYSVIFNHADSLELDELVEDDDEYEDEDDLQDRLLNMDEEMIELHFSDDAIHEIAISKNGRFVAYQCMFDDEINVIDVEKRTFFKKLSIIDAVNDMFFMENAHELIISLQNGKIVVCNWVEDTEELLFDLNDTVYSMDVTPDSKVALVGGYTTLYVLDLNARKIIRTMELDPDGGSIIDSVSISSHGTLGVSGSPHGPVHLWDLLSGIDVYTDKFYKNSSNVQLSANAHFALFATDDNLHHIIRIKEDNQLDLFEEDKLWTDPFRITTTTITDCKEMVFLPTDPNKVLAFSKEENLKVIIFDPSHHDVVEIYNNDYFGMPYSDLPTSSYTKISRNGEFVVLGEQDGVIRIARLSKEVEQVYEED